MSPRWSDENVIAEMKRTANFEVSIAQHQSVSNMLADMAIGFETARLAYYYLSAWEIDQGRQFCHTYNLTRLLNHLET